MLLVQLISLEHVSWPRRNVTATPKLARHILDVHTKLADLIELRDPSGARALMDDHVKMIRARRVAERGEPRPDATDTLAAELMQHRRKQWQNF